MKISVIDNKYRKVLAVAQRARQIQKGARPLVHVPGMRATRIALEEIERGLISFETIPGQE
ncbi:MAG TPA: DNA-directed RNA polymerase subunit omega [Blastocatellia bacterium]|nr:DNA-directed RNA polymerase subunit omega [Blastocatellia bacterium]